MKTFTLQLTREEVIALGRAIQDKVESLQSPSDMDDLYTLMYLMRVIVKLPEPEELDLEVAQ